MRFIVNRDVVPGRWFAKSVLQHKSSACQARSMVRNFGISHGSLAFLRSGTHDLRGLHTCSQNFDRTGEIIVLYILVNVVSDTFRSFLSNGHVYRARVYIIYSGNGFPFQVVEEFRRIGARGAREKGPAFICNMLVDY